MAKVMWQTDLTIAEINEKLLACKKYSVKQVKQMYRLKYYGSLWHLSGLRYNPIYFNFEIQDFENSNGGRLICGEVKKNTVGYIVDLMFALTFNVVAIILAFDAGDVIDWLVVVFFMYFPWYLFISMIHEDKAKKQKFLKELKETLEATDIETE